MLHPPSFAALSKAALSSAFLSSGKSISPYVAAGVDAGGAVSSAIFLCERCDSVGAVRGGGEWGVRRVRAGYEQATRA